MNIKTNLPENYSMREVLGVKNKRVQVENLNPQKIISYAINLMSCLL